MNDISKDRGSADRADEPRLERTGHGVTHCYWYTKFGCYTEGGRSQTISARGYKSAEGIMVTQTKRKYIVRRLTPLECCRLQGFPDWWTDGMEGSDSAKYKMWGNGIALPCAVDVLGRIKKEVSE